MANKTWEQKYKERYQRDIEQTKILCKENLKLFKEFFEYEEYKLKRGNSKGKLDESNYNNLYNLITRLLTIDRWFNHKAWVNLTEDDIKKVYDNVMDGKIKRVDGKPYDPRGLKDSYFDKIMKSKPFEMAGKVDLCRKVIVPINGSKEVRFIEEEIFKKILLNVYKPIHQTLFWVAWDIGENINALLKTEKRDYSKEINPDTNEPEYRVNLRKDILKRSRRARGVITNHPTTVKLLDQILLPIKNDNDLVFPFGYGTAKKIIDRAVERAGAKCIPHGEKVSWKDLRSGMACDLLRKGWSCDEVNSRLGHKPSSDEIDKYINFLAIDMHRPKKKLEEFKIQQLKKEIEELKEGRKLETMRNESMKNQMETMQNQIALIVSKENTKQAIEEEIKKREIKV